VTAPLWVPVLVAAIACVTDLRTRRIANVLTFGAAAGAVVTYGVMNGLAGVAFAASGWAVGLALFLPLFLLRGMGGGDVKLLAALGAWVGPGLAVWLALWSAVAGGLLAVIVALARGYGRQAFANVWGLLSYWRVMGVRPHPALTLEASTSAAPRLPYSLPIAAGLGLTLWLR
jgi:prepilin peptidase CpaA